MAARALGLDPVLTDMLEDLQARQSALKVVTRLGDTVLVAYWSRLVHLKHNEITLYLAAPQNRYQSTIGKCRKVG